MKSRLFLLLAISCGAGGQTAFAQFHAGEIGGFTPQQLRTLHALVQQASRVERPFVTRSSCHPRRESYSPGYGESSYSRSPLDLRVENELVETRAFWEKRRLRRQYLEEERQRRMFTEQDVTRLREHQESLLEILDINRQITEQRRQRISPGRPGLAEVNPVNGEIHCPACLCGAEFVSERIRLEAIFAQRARYRDGAWSTASEIPGITQAMRDDLKSLVRVLPSSESVAAKNLLRKLEYEARFPASAEGFAVR